MRGLNAEFFLITADEGGERNLKSGIGGCGFAQKRRRLQNAKAEHGENEILQNFRTGVESRGCRDFGAVFH